MLLLRRVDRRLREVTRAADGIRQRVRASDDAGPGLPELAWLRLKAEAAVQNGEPALFRRRRTARAAEVVALEARIRRHRRHADLALAGAERPPHVADTWAEPPAPGRLLRGVVFGLAGVAAALVVVLATGAPDRLAGTIPREGIVGGIAGSNPSPTAIDPSARGEPQLQPVVVAFDFDEVRMGEGIGDAWAGSEAVQAGSIDVAAFPTSFDRSARLTRSGTLTVACAAVAPNELERLGFDVYLDPGRPAVGTLSLYANATDPELEVVIDAGGPLGARVTGGELATGPRIAAGAWHRVELTVEAGTLRWRVHSRHEPAAQPADGSLGLAALAPITRICLAADGPTGGVVSYDNLELHGTNAGG